MMIRVVAVLLVLKGRLRLHSALALDVVCQNCFKPLSLYLCVCVRLCGLLLLVERVDHRCMVPVVFVPVVFVPVVFFMRGMKVFFSFL